MQSAVLAIVNPSVRPSVCLTVTRWHYVKTTQATIIVEIDEFAVSPLPYLRKFQK